MTGPQQPEAAPPVVGRSTVDDAPAARVEAEREVTRHGDRVSAARRRAHHLLLVQLPGPVERLEAWRRERGWDHTWVSSGGTTHDDDRGWVTAVGDWTGPQPGCSCYLLRDGRPYLTSGTRARGTEAVLLLAHVMDRTVHGRRQDREDSPEGWPPEPTCG